jgi:predicted DNA-binding antitoxin AbrB/MazE fold protein
MARQFEVIYEQVVLRPLQPLPFEESQHLVVTIADVPSQPGPDDRLEEQEWIRIHSALYPGQWVALQGSQLVSHGPRARAVRDEARAKGIENPLLAHLSAEPAAARS